MKEMWNGKGWWEFRRIRPDVTDYVVHWVKEKREGGKKISSFFTLFKILECGYLKPTFAIMRPLLYDQSPRPTIKGPFPAVCFTEQTLECFIKSCEHLSSGGKRYWPYGIALHKWPLFEYGGRPVIYGDQSILGRLLTPNKPGFEEGKEIYIEGLPKEFQYLWVRYSPIPAPEGYPIDFTHEREWRARVKAPYRTSESYHPEEGVPIFLPPVNVGGEEKKYSPFILVKEKEEKETLIEIVEICRPGWKEKCQNGNLKKQFDRYPEMKIIALEEVEEHLKNGERKWACLETLPL